MPVKKEQMNNTVDQFEEIEKLKQENQELRKSISEMMNMFKSVIDNRQPVNVTSKMDTPCSIIHLCECNPELPTSISVNGNTYYFTTFGERKTFRYQDLQNIISKYRSWFLRGVFALGEDCEQFRSEIPSDIVNINIPSNAMNNMVKMNIEDFEKFIKSFNKEQIVHIALTWTKRLNKGLSGYKDLEKLKILNKNTSGLLRSYIEKLDSEY